MGREPGHFKRGKNQKTEEVNAEGETKKKNGRRTKDNEKVQKKNYRQKKKEKKMRSGKFCRLRKRRRRGIGMEEEGNVKGGIRG